MAWASSIITLGLTIASYSAACYYQTRTSHHRVANQTRESPQRQLPDRPDSQCQSVVSVDTEDQKHENIPHDNASLAADGVRKLCIGSTSPTYSASDLLVSPTSSAVFAADKYPSVVVSHNTLIRTNGEQTTVSP